MRRHGAAAEIVAIGKAAGDDQQIRLGQLAVAMPDLERLLARAPFERIINVLLAIRAREDDDRGLHRGGPRKRANGVAEERALEIPRPPSPFKRSGSAPAGLARARLAAGGGGGAGGAGGPLVCAPAV